MDERTARVDRIVEHAPGTRSLHLQPPPAERLDFRPGQFVSCLIPTDGKPLVRPYSLASDPEDAELELCLDLVPGGAGSAHLFGLGVGGTIRFTGPWGTFLCDRAPDAEAVFIADGTGIVPLRPMLRRALATARHPLHLLHGVRDCELYGEELDTLAAADPRLTVERIPADALEDLVARRWVAADGDRSRHFFVCGVGAIVPRLRDLLRGAGYERRAVRYERW